MTMPADNPTADATLAYFKDRYAPLYRYADGVEQVASWSAVGIVGLTVIAGCAGLADKHGGRGGGAFVGVLGAFVAACVFAWLLVSAARLVAAAVRAFADMVVSSAPGLDAAARLTIIRGGAGVTDPAASYATREVTDYFAGAAPTQTNAAPTGPRVPRGFNTPPTRPADTATASPTPTAAAATSTARTTTTSHSTVTTDADVSLDDDFGEDPTRITPPPSAPPSALSIPSWYLARDGEPTGPWTEAQLRQGIVERTVVAGSLIWRVGEQGGWGRLDADPLLRASLAARR